jgi:predicted regulator of Ras-like GTPase activity (Roadblock/LC7/MglB family)
LPASREPEPSHVEPDPATTSHEPEPLNVETEPSSGTVQPQPLSVIPEPAAHTAEPEPLTLAPGVGECGKPPSKLGELFGQPSKLHWPPAEIIEHTVQLPGVAGAIVALQEGLQVAHSLPAGIKSEVVAAFLPQIFARLNQYAEEMKLGDVDDLLFTTHGAHCQIYRLGFLYFAVIGRPGEPLPWRELRIISEELAREAKH